MYHIAQKFFVLTIILAFTSCNSDDKELAKKKFKQATTAFTSKDLKKSLDLFNQAIELNPDLYNAYLNRGNCLQLMEKHSLALKDFNTYISKSKNGKYLMNAYYASGVSNHYLNQNTDAISNYSEAIKIQPNFSEAIFNRSKEYLIIGDTIRSCSDLQTCIDLGFNEAKTDLGLFCE